GAPHALAARVPSVIQKPWGAFPVLWKGFLFYNYLMAPCHKEICHAAIDKAFGGGGRKPAGRLRPFAAPVPSAVHARRAHAAGGSCFSRSVVCGSGGSACALRHGTGGTGDP